MKKNIFITVIFMLWASLAAAQQKASSAGTESQETPFEAGIHIGYRWVSLDGNTRAGEYEYLHSSAAGSVNLEWDPLPHRFRLESYYLNKKDFFGDLDYAYRDLVVFNLISRGLFHNLDHYTFAPDAQVGTVKFPIPVSSPSFADINKGDAYGTAKEMNRLFIRFKTPDFPFHLYAEARSVEKKGTVQQRFLDGYIRTSFDNGTTLVGDIHKVSQSREIEWKTDEIKIGANGHFGPVEMDYSHMEKRFRASGEKVLYDAYNEAWTGNPPTAVLLREDDTYPHNLVPDLESSSDTVKIHTSYTGRLVAAATYSSGDKKNMDSNARAEYWNAAGDIIYMPKTNLSLFLKYRHYDLDVRNPDTVTLTGLANSYTYNVRDSISSQKDILTGTVRYRPTDRLTLKGEYAFESIQREVGPEGVDLPSPPANAPAYWEVAHRTTKGTAKVGATYRLLNKLTLRADYSHLEVDHPAYNIDPDKSDSAKASLTWTPTQKFNTLLSYGSVREKRRELEAPLAGGERDAARDQALASFTVMMGQRSSITTSYAYYKNQVDHTITYHDGTGASSLESGVPYDDIAHVASLSLGHAFSDKVNLTADASRSYSRGNFRISGSATVTNVNGIAEFSDLKVIESVYSAGIEMQHTRAIGSELRYQYRDYDDQIDNTQDGTAQILLATVSMKW